MSKKAKARQKQKKLTAKLNSRNHQRHRKYEQLSSATPPTSTNGKTEHAGKSKGRFSGTGKTKVQKKRLAQGKPAEGYHRRNAW